MSYSSVQEDSEMSRPVIEAFRRPPRCFGTAHLDYVYFVPVAEMFARIDNATAIIEERILDHRRR